MIEIGDISDSVISMIKSKLSDAKWKEVKSDERDYFTWFPEGVFIEGFDIKQCFFLKIPPKGKVHPHIDTPRPERTYHIPIKTNKKAKTFIEGEEYYLKVGKVYEIDRQKLHYSINDGDSDRVHLILECM